MPFPSNEQSKDQSQRSGPISGSNLFQRRPWFHEGSTNRVSLALRVSRGLNRALAQLHLPNFERFEFFGGSTSALFIPRFALNLILYSPITKSCAVFLLTSLCRWFDTFLLYHSLHLIDDSSLYVSEMNFFKFWLSILVKSRYSYRII